MRRHLFGTGVQLSGSVPDRPQHDPSRTRFGVRGQYLDAVVGPPMGRWSASVRGSRSRSGARTSTTRAVSPASRLTWRPRPATRRRSPRWPAGAAPIDTGCRTRAAGPGRARARCGHRARARPGLPRTAERAGPRPQRRNGTIAPPIHNHRRNPPAEDELPTSHRHLRAVDSAQSTSTPKSPQPSLSYSRSACLQAVPRPVRHRHPGRYLHAGVRIGQHLGHGPLHVRAQCPAETRVRR